MRAKLSPLVFALSACLATGLAAQDSNIWFPIAEVEDLLSNADFEVAQMQDTRFEGDRTQRVTMKFGESSMMLTNPVGCTSVTSSLPINMRSLTS